MSREPLCIGETREQKREAAIRRAYEAGFEAGEEARPYESPWDNINGPGRRYFSKHICAWRRGYDAGMATRLRRSAAHLSEPKEGE